MVCGKRLHDVDDLKELVSTEIQQNPLQLLRKTGLSIDVKISLLNGGVHLICVIFKA